MSDEFFLTRQQARKIDTAAINQYGVKGLILMENAGRACAEEAGAMLGEACGKHVIVFCGPGNNGGDGFVLARHLENRGAGVRMFLVGRIDDILRQAGDSAVNLEIALNMGIPVSEIGEAEAVQAALEASGDADLIVDALFGTGLAGQVRGAYRSLINGMNELGIPILSVDIPSGLDCDTGLPLGLAVRASRTVTFVLPKRGFTRPEAAQYTGEVKVAEISVPQELIESQVARWRSEGR